MRILVLIGLILSVSASVKAQQTTYTLAECIDFAVNNSYETKRSRYAENEAEHSVSEAKAGLYPQINATGDLNHSLILPTTMLPGELIGQSGTQIPVQMGSKNELEFSVIAEQVVFSPQLFTGIKIARNRFELEKIKSSLTKEEVVYNVCQTYYDIRKTSSELECLAQIISMQDSLYRLMEKRVQQNITRVLDLNRVKINLTNLRSNAINVGNTLSQQMAYFKILLGVPLKDSFAIDNSEIIAKSDEYLILDEFHPQRMTEISVLNKRQQILALEMHGGKMQYLPSLSAFASAGYQFQSDKFRLSKDPWYNTAIIGLRLTVPIFDGFSRRSQIRKYKAGINNLEQTLLETEQTLSASFQNAKTSISVAGELMNMQSDNITLAETAYRQTLALYDEGLSDIIDVLETETSLLESRMSYITQLIQYKKAEVELLKSNGNLTEYYLKQ